MANDFELEGYEDLELSTQVLIRAALKRGIEVVVISRTENLILLRKDGHSEYVSKATETTADSIVTYKLMGDKDLCKQILSRAGIKTPQGECYNSLADALAAFDEVSKGATVVKPNSTNMGVGIHFLNKSFSKSEYKKALEAAFKLDSSVLVEEFVEGKEYRFLVIDGSVQGVCSRVPANIVGDGESSINELVKQKNEDARRGVGHVKPLEVIELGPTELEILKEQDLHADSVVAKDEQVFLRKNSNISTGGDSIDFTDIVHEGYKQIAVRAAQSIRASITGIDFLLQNPEEEPSDSNHAVIELNYNPVIYIHAFPYEGTSRPVAEPILDLIGF